MSTVGVLFEHLKDVYLIAELASASRATMVMRVREIAHQYGEGAPWREVLALFDREVTNYRRGHTKANAMEAELN